MSQRCPDTSVVVAGLSSWHPDHEVAHEVLAGSTVGIAHVIVESYSVLTRLPHAQRVPASIAWQAVRSTFGGPPIALPPNALDSLFARLVATDIAGGATYDAIVAETARSHELELVSFDQRATRTYDVVGVGYVLIAPTPPT